MDITVEQIQVCAERRFNLLRPPTGVPTNRYEEKFVSHFGCNSEIATQIWNLINNNVETLYNHDNIVWFLAALYFIKTYPTMATLSTKLGKSEDSIL